MDTLFDSALEDDIKQILAEVPPPVRAFFASGKVEIVAKSLMQKYQLHIDTGAIVEREIILLLLGLKDPTEFTQTLVEEAKLDQQTINNITQDVNELIFVPLREEMRKSGGKVEETAKPVVTPPSAPPPPHYGSQTSLPPRTTIIPANPQMPARPAQIPILTPKYVPPQKYVNLQNKVPPPTSSKATRASSETSQGAAQGPAPMKPMESNKLLEDHEEPHIEFKKVPPPPPPNLPGAIHHPALIPKVEAPPSLPPRVPASPAPAKPYSSDPYREPIE